MTVTLNKKEILHRAYRFMKDSADADYEMGQAQDFIRELCQVFGFSHKRLVSFEQRVKKLGGRHGRIDGFYPGKLLIEMKSRGEDLEAAYGYKGVADDAARVAFLFGVHLQLTGVTAETAPAKAGKTRPARQAAIA